MMITATPANNPSDANNDNSISSLSKNLYDTQTSIASSSTNSIRSRGKPLPIPPQKQSQRITCQWGMALPNYSSNAISSASPKSSPELDTDSFISHYTRNSIASPSLAALAAEAAASPSDAPAPPTQRPSITRHRSASILRPISRALNSKFSVSSLSPQTSQATFKDQKQSQQHIDYQPGRSFIELESPKQKHRLVGKLKTMLSMGDLKKDKAKSLNRHASLLPPPPPVSAMTRARSRPQVESAIFPSENIQNNGQGNKHAPSLRVRFQPSS